MKLRLREADILNITQLYVTEDLHVTEDLNSVLFNSGHSPLYIILYCLSTI